MKHKVILAMQIIVTVFVMVSPSLWADEISKPHTFVPGTTAKASEVNANFDTVYNQVNKIGSQINIDSANSRVGIGTTSPSGTLHVDGGTAAAGNNGSDITIEAQDGATNFNGGNIILMAGSGQGTGTDGNVGIGTMSPGTKLEVSGQVKITGGTPAAGEVLTSDAAGLATWEAPSKRHYASVSVPASGTTVDFIVTQGAFTPPLPESLSVVPTIEVFITEVSTNYPGGTGGNAHNMGLSQTAGTPFNGSNPLNGLYLNVSIDDKIRFGSGGNSAASVGGTFKIMIIAIN